MVQYGKQSPLVLQEPKYQEILTDPSYAGQFVLMTNPHIGNTGINFDDVDTRAITRRLRQDGSLIGVLSTDNSKTDEELLQMSQSWDIVGIDLISGVSCKSPLEWVDKTKQEWEFISNKRPGEASETLKIKPDGVLFSNGRGDPSAVPYAVETVKNILGKALGGKTFKMKFGHHGGNHPIPNLRTGFVEISAQVYEVVN
ncbi:unnamed protein product [Lupinus luteus]|uniref:Carbamoyl-phosphate synthase small subunit N-terminal domain-containing protein n=1 Tax=Lupinus luteus TaxID=3873 RepID=A0AAV1W7S8_LUPLU